MTSRIAPSTRLEAEIEALLAEGLADPARLAEREHPSAAACLAEDLPALTVHLRYPARLRKRLRSTNVLERFIEEVKRRSKVIGRFPGETSCLSLCWAVLDLVIAGARGLGLTAIERQQIHALRVQRIQATTIERSA